MSKEIALIVGLGEVGMALLEILAQAHDVYTEDPEFASQEWYRPLRGQSPDVMHVCFPYSPVFVESVSLCQRQHRPACTVIHSTVPVGTSRECGAVHSPVMGRHPRLAEDLLLYTKFIGGENGSAVADHFREAGMRIYLTDKQETTETIKLYSTLYYAVCVEFTKEVKRACVREQIPFEAWTLWTDAYNEGAIASGRAEAIRPNLVPILSRIGGHCLLPNLEMIESVFADFVRERNR